VLEFVRQLGRVRANEVLPGRGRRGSFCTARRGHVQGRTARLRLFAAGSPALGERGVHASGGVGWSWKPSPRAPCSTRGTTSCASRSWRRHADIVNAPPSGWCAGVHNHTHHRGRLERLQPRRPRVPAAAACRSEAGVIGNASNRMAQAVEDKVQAERQARDAEARLEERREMASLADQRVERNAGSLRTSCTMSSAVGDRHPQPRARHRGAGGLADPAPPSGTFDLR